MGSVLMMRFPKSERKYPGTIKLGVLGKQIPGENTFAVQSTHNPSIYEIREEMAQMRSELGLVLKHVTGGVEKNNAVNYLAKPPPPNGECYYEEDSYAVHEQMGGGFRPRAQGSN